MNSVRFHVEAEAELDETASFYEALASGLGKSFTAEVKKTVRLIQAHPAAGQNISPRLKKSLVHRFPYSLIYSIDAQAILILAIAHHRRRPGYWHQRQT
ncbi:type II toxin-antitoxin system RelE/ParE family toxin [Duganella sp. Leaf126]|uniref:type II toxin-antitoxin system RelE/ParE family toxin n=1 Tax=Duganella sp. Leaf126 TaxID=1736266 RepID=UPI000AAFD2AE|nr:type II toxin-antitoxin system RelE/ParE family toxin [Duganella sp. Leaf126]